MHGSLAGHVHNPPHSSRPLECGWLAACDSIYMRTPPTHFYLDFSGWPTYMKTYPCTILLKSQPHIQKKKVFYPNMQCPFTAFLSCPLEHGSEGGLMPILLGELCGYCEDYVFYVCLGWLLWGLCVLRVSWDLVLVSVFSQVGPRLVSFLISFLRRIMYVR